MKRVTALWAAAAWASTAFAQPSVQPSDYARRFAAECAACHGAQGRSTTALTPSLAGQPGFYAITQLFLFRQGRRDNAAMAAVAKGMSDAELRGFSELIGKLPPPVQQADAKTDAARVERGLALAAQHRCMSCHGKDFDGGQQVPRLAGQREDYLQQTLREFKSGRRVGYTQAMNEALSGLAPEQLDDVAHALAHAPAR